MSGYRRQVVNVSFYVYYSLDIAILYSYHIAMIQVNISTLKNQLSAYLRKVKKGEEILVMDRDHPVAKISVARANDLIQNDEDLVDELERRGIIRRATKKLPKDWFEKHPPIKVKGSVLEALLEDRWEARY